MRLLSKTVIAVSLILLFTGFAVSQNYNNTTEVKEDVESNEGLGFLEVKWLKNLIDTLQNAGYSLIKIADIVAWIINGLT